jgi:CRP-like cAMP-binding protein
MRPPQTFDVDILLSKLVSSRAPLEFRKKQVIFSQGDRSDALFYIERGNVKLTVVSDKGKEVIICVSGAGTFVGESCIASGEPSRFHSAVALTDVRVRKINRSAIVKVLRDGGDIALAFITHLLRREVRIQEDLASKLVNSTEASLARVLVSLAESKEKGSREPSARLSQQTLAEMIGVTRQRVNVLMKRFKTSNIVERTGTSSVPKSASHIGRIG